MRPNAPFFIILLCLMPDDFNYQEESSGTQWVKVRSYICKFPGDI